MIFDPLCGRRGYLCNGGPARSEKSREKRESHDDAGAETQAGAAHGQPSERQNMRAIRNVPMREWTGMREPADRRESRDYSTPVAPLHSAQYHGPVRPTDISGGAVAAIGR